MPNKIDVYRPVAIFLNKKPINIQDTSNAFLSWDTEFCNYLNGNKLITPKDSFFNDLISSIHTFSHKNQNPIIIRRFSSLCKSEIKVKNSSESEYREIKFVKDDKKVAIGYEMPVDGIEFKVKISTELLINKIQNSKETEKALRIAIYKDEIKNGKLKKIINNPFLREWLGNIYSYNLIFTAIIKKISLEEANTLVFRKNSDLTFENVLNIIFQSHSIDIPPNNGNIDEEDLEVGHLPSISTERLKKSLLDQLDNKDVLTILKESADLLFGNDFLQYSDELVSKYLSTIAGSAYNAFLHLCPDVDTNSIVIDIHKSKDSKEDEFSIYICETSPGGIGVIDAFVEIYSQDPRNFFRLMRSSLNENELELNDQQLQKILKLLCSDNIIKDKVYNFRQSQDNKRKLDSFNELINELSSQNFILYHSFTTTFSNRILRHGSSNDTDRFLKQIFERWISEEKDLKLK